MEPTVNKWGQWINLNWDWSRRICDERVSYNNMYKNVHKLFRGGDWVWMPNGQLGQVQSCNYSTYDIHLGEHKFSIIVAVRAKLYYFHRLSDLRLEKNAEVINRNKERLVQYSTN